MLRTQKVLMSDGPQEEDSHDVHSMLAVRRDRLIVSFSSFVRFLLFVCFDVFDVKTIIQGWRLATATARKVLANTAEDNGKDDVKFREDLTNIAKCVIVLCCCCRFDTINSAAT